MTGNQFSHALGDRVFNRTTNELGIVKVQALNSDGVWYHIGGVSGGELGWWAATEVGKPPKGRPPQGKSTPKQAKGTPP